MSWSLTPGKLGFLLDRVLVALKAGTTDTPVAVLSSSNSLMSIDVVHAKVHAGQEYRYSDAITLANAATQDYLITTPAGPTQIHFAPQADGSAVTTFTLFEGSDKTGTTLQPTFNSNRPSANTTGLTIRKGTSGGTTDGTAIQTYSGGSASNQSQSSTQSPARQEWVLKPSTKYIWRVLSGTDGNKINIGFSWYEHVDS